MPGLSENLLQLNVYFKTLNLKTVTEDPVYVHVSDDSLVIFLCLSLKVSPKNLEFSTLLISCLYPINTLAQISKN